MSLDYLKKLVSEGAPILATVLGSPLAGVGLSLLGNTFGADPKNVKDIVEKISNDPESLAKLKKLEYEHEENLGKIANDTYKIDIEDKANARARQIALKDHVPTFLALGFLINYAIMQFYCVTHPGTENDIISARFQDVLIMIISYYFGSSHKEKPSPS